MNKKFFNKIAGILILCLIIAIIGLIYNIINFKMPNVKEVYNIYLTDILP